MMTEELQQAVERGRQALEFKRYCEQEGYLNNLLDTFKMVIMNEMVTLDFQETEEFKRLSVEFRFIDKIYAAIENDIEFARQCHDVLAGNVAPEGSIL